MAVPSFKEISVFLAFGLYPKRLYPKGVNWMNTENFRKYASNFELDDNGVLCLNDDGRRVEILDDKSKRFSTFQVIHAKQHFNFKQTCAEIGMNYFWFGMERDIKCWVQSCEVCQKVQKKQSKFIQVVLLDHSYTRKMKKVSTIDCKEEEERLPATSDGHTSSSVHISSVDGQSCLSSTGTSSMLDSASDWDHDYVADKLTLRRKLHLIMHGNEGKKQEKKDVRDVCALQAELLASQGTPWDLEQYKINFNCDVLPHPEDVPFSVLLGLEVVVNQLNDMERSPNEAPVIPPVLPCAQCVKCATSTSTSWHKNTTKQILCYPCHKNEICQENINDTKQNFVSYRKKYNGNYSLIKSQLEKRKLETNNRRRNLDSKRKEALTRLSNMRKLALFKANMVTRTLLRNKGAKSMNIDPEKVITQKIRTLMADPAKRLHRNPNPTDSVVKALTHKQNLQEYLEYRLEKHKHFLRKQISARPQTLKSVNKSTASASSAASSDSSESRRSLNDVRRKVLLHQIQGNPKIRRVNHTTNATSNLLGNTRQLPKRVIQTVKLRDLSKKV